MFLRSRAAAKNHWLDGTIRRAADQVKALFNRNTCQFPPPAIDHDDSGFAVLDWSKARAPVVGIVSARAFSKVHLASCSRFLYCSSGAAAFKTDAERDPVLDPSFVFIILCANSAFSGVDARYVHDSLKTLAVVRNENSSSARSSKS